MNRVIRTVLLASHPDKWRSSEGQPGFDTPELAWVGDVVFRRMQGIKEQWLLAEKANNSNHSGHRYYLPFPARQVPPPIQKDGVWATPGGKLDPNAAASAKAGGTKVEPGKSAIEWLN
eukprot:9200745-Lingulodinium_polyedra.AAC.1